MTHMRNYWVWPILVGIIVIIIAVIEWFGKISVIHALAILTGIVGLSIALGGVGSRAGTPAGPVV